MGIDIPSKSIQAYLGGIKPQKREAVLKVICDSEAFVNSFDSDKVKIMLETIAAKIIDETTGIVTLVKNGKYNKENELHEIRKKCIGIAKLVELVDVWERQLENANKHVDKILKLEK